MTSNEDDARKYRLAQRKKLLDLFEGANGRPARSIEEFHEWFDSPAGRAATAYHRGPDGEIIPALHIRNMAASLSITQLKMLQQIARGAARVAATSACAEPKTNRAAAASARIGVSEMTHETMQHDFEDSEFDKAERQLRFWGFGDIERNEEWWFDLVDVLRRYDEVHLHYPTKEKFCQLWQQETEVEIKVQKQRQQVIKAQIKALKQLLAREKRRGQEQTS